MTQQEALTILVQTAEFAQSKGILTLNNAVIIAEAVKVFQQPEKEQPPVGETKDETYEESND